MINITEETVQRSPNELMDKAKEIMLNGAEPITIRDWYLIVNFWAQHIYFDIQPEGLELICLLFHVPLDKQEIRKISRFQRAKHSEQNN